MYPGSLVYLLCIFPPHDGKQEMYFEKQNVFHHMRNAIPGGGWGGGRDGGRVLTTLCFSGNGGTRAG